MLLALALATTKLPAPRLEVGRCVGPRLSAAFDEEATASVDRLCRIATDAERQAAVADMVRGWAGAGPTTSVVSGWAEREKRGRAFTAALDAQSKRAMAASQARIDEAFSKDVQRDEELERSIWPLVDMLVQTKVLLRTLRKEEGAAVLRTSASRARFGERKGPQS